MTKQHFPYLLLLPCLVSSFALWIAAQQGQSDRTVIHKVVDMVQLNVAVTDRKGRYITGLRPSDFLITEDGITQKMATFEEGNEAPRTVADIEREEKNRAGATADAGKGSGAQPENSTADIAQGDGDSKAAAPRAAGASALLPGGPASNGGSDQAAMPLNSAVAGADVFILFDSSNYMYPRRGFVFAQDAIADFVRSLDGPDRIAFYSYSRDLSRAATLTADRTQVLHGVRETVDGDDSALYNALLLTLKDASQYSGRKVVVVFSNGPDNASTIAPEDVGELAQSEGVPIYMVSTHEARLDPVSTAVFGRISASTGGEAFINRNWQDQRQAFRAIKNDLAHLYLLSYYPQPNPNRGWRTIKVKLMGERLKRYRIRTRSGYRPVPPRVAVNTAAPVR